jgi:DNA-binding protein H-NS
MADLAALKAQAAALQEQIRAAEATVKQRRDADLKTVHDAVAAHGFTRNDVFPIPPLPAKYRDPTTGATWSGRGYRPKWLESKVKIGVPIETFAI